MILLFNFSLVLVLGVVFPSGTQEVTEGDTVPVCITTNTTTDIRLSVIIDIMDITTACMCQSHFYIPSL